MDEAMVRRAAKGDAGAFTALARDRIDRLFAVAFRILRDHHDAEDAVQEALWKAWCDLRGLRDPARFDAWLYQVLVRSCYRAGRSRRRRAFVIEIVPEDRGSDVDDGPDRVGDRDAIDRAFAALSTEHRAVVVLHHYLGLDLDEIAEVVGIPHGTARSRLHYALRRMRESIAPGEAMARAAEASR
jgi:RNA polymerase sigma-70 factor, ECF subfamily